ncbi:hypothetical protein CTI12_AA247430 [Artemisia annua]|uniref:Uncharacterized protein n=1 Tax=Artemisia annua TaxID=35608 RepID=A0A2U1LTH5_ARTAN|nr:hypothetical protein CTI12_AA247430 [Artemisia annua]
MGKKSLWVWNTLDSHLEVNTLNFFDIVESKTRTPSPSPNDETEDVASVGREGDLNQTGRVVDDVQDDTLEQILYPGAPQQPVDSSSATPLDENSNSEGNALPETDVPSFQNVFKMKLRKELLVIEDLVDLLSCLLN